MSDLTALEQRAIAELHACGDEAALRQWHTRYFGKQGEVALALKRIAEVPPPDRRSYGQEANRIKEALTAAYEEALRQAKERALNETLHADAVDVTLPGRPVRRGRLHVATQTLRTIASIFTELGFQIYRSREVEDDATNFELLNMPPHHPARDMWDTFYTEVPGVLLRTHTSPGQIHVMREFCPKPIRVILPGMCYRYEAITPRSEIMFHQVEGLAIGRHVTMADLKGTIVAFARRMFGEQRRVRIRSSYFPFTEPSIEVDMDCIVCSGKGCGLCKRMGWLEIMGAGMVHPVVLRNGGYDPDEYSGFAFGMGPQRIAMLQYAIDDIRQFWANDLRFLQQF
ncbi:MAG: phenylalanine--tRNA ligase subunit alpha [Gemmataceae bacterium]|nr:phenylalanine--tRNA ligase subunit alpha [Gemmataceae bacterium]MDW8264733.1 phenylalanine--tRNA ligase subunit alpha [Gemmataceae bacterium]